MPRIRGLNFSRFISAVPPDLVARFFERIPTDDRPDAWATLNPDALLAYLSDPANAEHAALIGETFQRISDISGAAAPVLYRACERYEIATDSSDDETPTALGFRVFLDHPEAFEFAWARYLLYGTGAKLSTYPFPRGTQAAAGPEALQAFRLALTGWLSNQAKGIQCRLQPFNDDGDLVLLVQRGTYVQTVSFWEGDELRIQSFRPAVEDVIVFEPETALLRVKAAYPAEREKYLRLFAAHFAGDPSLADDAIATELFSLAPIQDGTFNYRGAGSIVGIELVKARLKLFGAAATVIEVKSADVLDSFRRDLGGLSLQSGLLLMARFKFRIKWLNERETTVKFEIDPPGRSDLTEHRHLALILRYLEEQGVKLR